MSTSLRLNILETKGDSGLFLTGKCPRGVEWFLLELDVLLT